jgi:ribosomal 30S subunit maturation factor RimM
MDNLLKEKLEQIVHEEGRLLEERVIFHMKRKLTTGKVYAIYGIDGEACIVVETGRSNDIMLYVVKSSKERSESYCRRLVDTELNDRIGEYGRIVKRTVIYLGNTCRLNANGTEVMYLNIDEFFRHDSFGQ